MDNSTPADGGPQASPDADGNVRSQAAQADLPGVRAEDREGQGWLFAGGCEPTQLVDEARALLEDDERQLEFNGFRALQPGQGYRRKSVGNRGRPELAAVQLELARKAIDMHKGKRDWSDWDETVMVEVHARCMNAPDLGALRSDQIPKWWRLEGSDGAPLVPARLRPLVAIAWAAYVRDRFGVAVSMEVLAAELGRTRKTVQNMRREAVRLGLLQRGNHAAVDKATGERTTDHNELPRLWVEGKTNQRRADQGVNLLRIGPVLEALAGDRPGGKSGPGARRALERRLLRASRVSAFRRTAERWREKQGPALDGEGLPVRRARGPRPVSADVLERTRVTGARAPSPRRSPDCRRSGSKPAGGPPAVPRAPRREPRPRSRTQGWKDFPSNPDPASGALGTAGGPPAGLLPERRQSGERRGEGAKATPPRKSLRDCRGRSDANAGDSPVPTKQRSGPTTGGSDEVARGMPAPATSSSPIGAAMLAELEAATTRLRPEPERPPPRQSPEVDRFVQSVRDMRTRRERQLDARWEKQRAGLFAMLDAGELGGES